MVILSTAPSFNAITHFLLTLVLIIPAIAADELLVTGTPLQSAAADERPNFVFLFMDDWGWGDVGAYQGSSPFHLTGTRSQTPTIDKLAQNGTLYTDYHTAQSFCAPSRTSYMTSRWPADLHVNSNWNTGANGAEANHKVGLPYQLPLPSGKGPSPYPGGLPNVASVMQAAGYATAHYGKWHLGGLSPRGDLTPKPSDYGFDHTGTYGSPIQADPSLIDEQNQPAGNFSDPWWSADVGDYIANAGIAFMRNATAQKNPFYLHLWFHYSHDTLDPRAEQMSDFPFKETCLFPSKMAGQTICPSRIFWGAQTYADKFRLAPVIAAVDDLGIRDNTYVIFSTDNGAQANKWTNSKNKGAFDNAVGTQGPFRGCKGSLYDGGHRVPFIMTGPGVPKGRVDHSLLSSVDWLPTIASLGGATIPQGTIMHGEDQSAIWHGKTSNVINRTNALLWRNAGGPAPCWNRAPSLAIRNGDWNLLINPTFEYFDGLQLTQHATRVELYNMSVNQFGTGLMNGAFLGEAQNFASYLPDVVNRMAEPLLKWHKAVGPISPGRTDKQMDNDGCESWAFPGM